MTRASLLAIAVIQAACLSQAPLNVNLPASAATFNTGVAQAPPPAGPIEPRANQTASDGARAFLAKNCVGCHNGRLRTAGLALDAVDLDDVTANSPLWEKVIRKLRTGAMPPASQPRPDPGALEAFVSRLETTIDRDAKLTPMPGRPAVRRLNRAEYANVIRDLLALDIDTQALLPPDDSGYGFDNIGDVLSVSPMLMERYMSASGKISHLAVGLADPVPSSHTYTLSKYLRQDDRMGEELPFGSRGGMAIRHNFPLTGDYVARVRLLKNHRDQIRGLTQPHRLEVRLDGERLQEFTVGRERSTGKPTREQAEDMQQYVLRGDENLDVRFRTTAGSHALAVSFLLKPMVPEGVLGPTLSVASFGFSGAAIDDTEDPAVWSVRIDGPFDATEAGDTPSRRRIFVCRPTTEQEEIPCARRILASLARRAYRRPVVDADVHTLIEFYREGRSRGSFDRGIELAVRRILVSPEFLFLLERDPVTRRPGGVYQLSDLELASRLSFFLWSSIPDEELLDRAEQRKLADPAVLQQQIRRMMADPRSAALMRNFAGQWLYLRNMKLVSPDPNVFPEFDDNLREAFQRETELFLDSQVREDRSILELLTSDYTFVNQRLARHYGIPKVYGSHFRRVQVADPERRGLLGHGSILTVTSYATRTSPVSRGKWLLENFLGAPPPPPPPNIPALKEIGEKGVAPSSVRERMELHRKNPVCASCHAQMDPLGFALENFDAVGKWRTMSEAGTPIDASAVLPSGARIAGPGDLRDSLLRTPDTFVTAVAEKLLTYATGRGLHYYDAPSVRQIVKQAAADGYRWSSLIRGVVASAPFQMRAAEPAAESRRAEP